MSTTHDPAIPDLRVMQMRVIWRDTFIVEPPGGVTDQRVSPTSSWELAGKIAELIEVSPCGLLHVAAPDSCSWHEFAQAILDRERPGVSVEPIGSVQYKTRAKRPALSALAGSRLAEVGVDPCRPWSDMLHEYLDARRRRATCQSTEVRQSP